MNIPAEGTKSASGRETGFAFQMAAFIGVRTLFNVAVRMVYPFLGVFQRGLGVDSSLFSFGLALRSASGIFGPFLASTADRYGRRTGMLLGTILFSVGACLAAIWSSFPAFLAMLILTILGNFVFIPSMQAYLGDKVPYARRGAILAVTEFSWSFSFILGIPLIGLAIRLSGWRAPFPGLAVLGILSLASLTAVLPRTAEPTGDGPSLRQSLGKVFSRPQALAGLALGMALSSSNELVSVTFSAWLETSFQVKVAALAGAAFVIGASELGGEGLASVVVDRLGKLPSFQTGLALNTLAALALPFLGSRLGGALAGLFLLYLTFEFCVVCSIPLMTEVLPARRATYMAAYIASLAMGRALADLVGLRMFYAGQASTLASGMVLVTLSAAGLNLLAWIATRLVRVDALPTTTPSALD